MRPRHLAPSAALAGLALLSAAAPSSPAARRALGGAGVAYAAAAMGAGVSGAVRVDLRLAPTVAFCFTALHLGYGVGMIEGLAEWAAARVGLREPQNAVARR